MLEPYRVLDLTDERGLLCGMILGDLGADVVRIEPPGGNTARRVSPAGSLWGAWARNSRSIVLDLERPEGQAALRRLAADADFVIESGEPGEMAARGLGPADLTRANPALVYVSITPYGQTGPKAGAPATDLTVLAASGALIMTGDADRPPLHPRGHHGWAHAGAEAAGAALVAHRARCRTGLGQHVDVSAQEAASLAAAFQYLSDVVGWPHSHRAGAEIVVGDIQIPTIFEASDGFVSVTFFFGTTQGPYSRRLMEWIHEEGECDAATRDKDWIGYLQPLMSGTEPRAELDRVIGIITGFIRTRTVAGLFAEAQRRSVMLAPCWSAAQVLCDPQLADRSYWWVADDVTDAPRVPGPFARFGRTPLSYRRRAPRLGEHTDQLLDEGRSPNRWTVKADENPALAGVKVIDFSWVMAGPWATRFLADFGATVVKIESDRRLDGLRVLPPFIAGKQHPENGSPFQSVNAGKHSVTLDPTVPAGRDVVLELVRWADVVFNSYSPKVMPSWKLTYEDLAAVKPEIISVSSSLFGQTGPYALMPGVGTMGSAVGGLLSMTGWPGRPPTGPWGAYTDFVSPRFTVAAILAALDHRDRTGEGQWIDVSQVESSIPFIAPELFDHVTNGTPVEPIGNDDPDMVPHGVYPAAGEDQWVAIACRNDFDWRALCTAIGMPSLAEDSRLADLEGRRCHRDEIDGAIASWSMTLRAGDAEATLLAARVPAAALVDHASAMSEPQLLHRGHVLQRPHRLLGPTYVVSTHVRLSRTPACVERAGPTLGESTEDVLTSILGYGQDRIAKLRDVGAVSFAAAI